MNDLKVVVITGASAGVGRATARAFAKKKISIALIARDLGRLDKTLEEVKSAGSRGIILPVDIASPEQVFAAAEKVEQTLGPIDLWINNAMTTTFSPFAQITAEEYKRATEVTYLGTVYGTMAALKFMMSRNRGTIIQVGSALAYRSIPLQSPYCAAKSAIRAFTDSLRSELFHDKSRVHITMVHLPALNTPQFEWCQTRMPHHPRPVPPVFQPEAAAKAIVWSAYHKRRELFVGFPTLKAVIGTKFIPGFLDRMLASTAYKGQQTDDELSPGRPSNLFLPVQGGWSAHGRFDSESAPSSLLFELTIRRKWIGIGAGVISLLLLAFLI